MMNFMNNSFFKWFSIPVTLMLMALVSCEKIGHEPFHEDGSEITATEAVEIVRAVIDEYVDDGYFWLISKEPVPARTTLKYGSLEEFDSSSECSGTFKSPGYKAWLVFFYNALINGSISGDYVCVFVNAQTGEFEKEIANGEICDMQWDMSFFVPGEDSESSREYLPTKVMQTSSNPLTSSSRLYAVIISGGSTLSKNFSHTGMIVSTYTKD